MVAQSLHQLNNLLIMVVLNQFLLKVEKLVAAQTNSVVGDVSVVMHHRGM